jgi:peptidase C39-like protein
MPLRVNEGIPIWPPPPPEPIAEGIGDELHVPPLADPSLMTFARPRSLRVPMIEQIEGNWCWAACIQMIMAFFGDDLDQCSVAGLLFSDRNCCANRRSCNEGCDPEDVERVLESPPLEVNCRREDGVISFESIVNEIDGGRPVAVGILWRNSEGEQTGGHLIIVRGWRIHNNKQYVKVNDPFYGPGDVPYSKLRTYYGPPDDDVDGVWKHTWIGIERG